MSQNLLIVLDPDLKAPQPALSKALLLAREKDLEITVFVNAYSGPMVRAVGLDEERFNAAKKQITHAWEQRIYSLAGAHPVSLALVWARREMDALRTEILRLLPDLLVVHTSREQGLRRHLFTPRDWQLIRKAPCPVLCVHSESWEQPPRWLVALDPGEQDDDAAPLANTLLSHARTLTQSLNGKLQACHVMDGVDDSLVMLVAEGVPDYAATLESLKAHHKQQFLEYARSQGLDSESVDLLEGPVADALARHCEENQIDVLVVGTVRRNLAERMLLGSTAETVITRARSDVLVIKPDRFESPWVE